LLRNSEINWWRKLKGKVNADYYKNSAEEIRRYLKKQEIQLTENTSVLEIGSGMCGILTFLNECRDRYAIDPLESAFAEMASVTTLRDKAVKYFTAVGEDIPFDAEKFDLVILDNVLDHCENPEKVIREINRVLKPGGIIYFRQNTYNYYGKFARSLMEVFLIDKGHPFTFTKTNLKQLFKKAGFNLISTKRTGYLSTWLWEITSNSLKDKIKALLFVTRDKVTYLIRKE